MYFLWLQYHYEYVTFLIYIYRTDLGDDICYTSSNAEWNQILKEAKKRHRNGTNHGSIFAVLFDFPYEHTTSIEDYSPSGGSGIPPSGKVISK